MASKLDELDSILDTLDTKLDALHSSLDTRSFRVSGIEVCVSRDCQLTSGRHWLYLAENCKCMAQLTVVCRRTNIFVAYLWPLNQLFSQDKSHLHNEKDETHLENCLAVYFKISVGTLYAILYSCYVGQQGKNKTNLSAGGSLGTKWSQLPWGSLLSRRATIAPHSIATRVSFGSLCTNYSDNFTFDSFWTWWP